MVRVSRLFLVLPIGLLGALPLANTAAQSVPVAAGVATPEPYVPPDYIRARPSVPPGLGKRQPRPLSLREAIELTLRNNLSLNVEREVVYQADEQRPTAIGNFEPTLSASISRSTSQAPPKTAQDGRVGQLFQTTNDLWSLNLSGTLPTGTSLGLAFSNFRTDSTLGSAVAPLVYGSSLTFSVVQPILRNFSFDNRVPWSTVLLAQFGSEMERENARLTAITTIKRTEDLYWGLVLSWKTWEVKRGAYQLMENQIELTRRMIAAGIKPEAELIKVQADLAGKQVDMLAAEAAIEDAADAMRQQLNLAPAEWEQPLLTVDAPNFDPMALAFDDAWKRALASRPELKMRGIDLKKDTLALQVARNGLLPQLNLRSSIGTIGQDQSYANALNQVANRLGWQWVVGADFSWSPLMIGARSGVRTAVSEIRRDHLQRELWEAQIRFELRAAMRRLETAERQVYASAKSRDLTERSLDVEQRRFTYGLSDNFRVMQQQAAVEQARLAELTAIVGHEQARSELLRSLGELLEARHLRFVVRSER